MVRAVQTRTAAEQGRDPRSVSGAGALSAAIWRASAPPRLPISARSRSGCRWRNRRCWWRCRNRRKRAGSIVIPTSRASRATACSTAWSRMASYRLRTRSRPRQCRCRGCASRCRCSRRIPPIRRVAHRQGCGGIRLTMDAQLAEESWKSWRATAPRALGPEYFGRDRRGRQ